MLVYSQVTIKINISDSCPYKETDEFDVTFHNSYVYPIDVIMFYPEKKVMRSDLSPQNEWTVTTSFAHIWTFVRSGTNNGLTVRRNEVASHVFKGCLFKARANQRILVYISGGKIYAFFLAFRINFRFFFRLE